jgi:hypothetical protein
MKERILPRVGVERYSRSDLPQRLRATLALPAGWHRLVIEPQASQTTLRAQYIVIPGDGPDPELRSPAAVASYKTGFENILPLPGQSPPCGAAVDCAGPVLEHVLLGATVLVVNREKSGRTRTASTDFTRTCSVQTSGSRFGSQVLYAVRRFAMLS